jgi:hypothetical protein
VPDSPLQRRLLGIAVLVTFLAGLHGLHRFWTSSMWHLTGPAKWVWLTDDLERLYPEVGLFVAKLNLAAPPPSALLKICADREYVVWVNGTIAACGWSRPGFRLDLYDIAHLLRVGDNTLVVEARSPTPVGGLLASLDVDGLGRDVLVTGRDFVLRRRFSLQPPAPDEPRPPVSWGSPPRFPWGYPSPQPHPGTLDEVVTEDPIRIVASAAEALPGGGLAFRLPAAPFGYLVLEYAGDGASSVWATPDPGWWHVFMAHEWAQPVVRAPGERRYLDPEPRRQGTVMVFGSAPLSAVEIWPIPAGLSPVAPGAVVGKLGPVPRTRWTTRNPPA